MEWSNRRRRGELTALPRPARGGSGSAFLRSCLITVLSAIGFKIFGVTLTVSRLVSAALGTLTIYVAYRLGRALDGVWLGLAFSFLLAVSPWNVTISRYGDLEHVTSPLQFLLSLLFVVLALQTGRVRDILLAGVFTAGSWYIYAPNQAVPAIVALFLLCRAALDPRRAARNWARVLLGIGCFAIVSYPALRLFASTGILQPNVRTGYEATGPILSDLSGRVHMIRLEADQLFRHADDPWFETPGGGLGLLQGTLLVPGLVLAANALRRHRYRDLALLVVIGLPIAFLPAILAPDVSFRRLMLVATLVALVTAFTLVRLAEAARVAGVSRHALTLIACTGAVAISAAGTYGYFDRTYVDEEARNVHFRALGATVADLLGKKPLLVVVPSRDYLNDAHKYIELMAYDKLQSAQRRGVPQTSLYVSTSCQDALGSERPQAVRPPSPTLILDSGVVESPPPCGPGFVSQLSDAYPGSRIVVATQTTSN
jgi:4-amino-4-deoxy-L-arabinose transferase-like glycosyltransferase